MEICEGFCNEYVFVSGKVITKMQLSLRNINFKDLVQRIAIKIYLYLI